MDDTRALMKRLAGREVIVPAEDASVRDVIDAFLHAIQPLSSREAGKVTGISHSTIAKLRAGEPLATYHKTLHRMREFLQRVAELHAPPRPTRDMSLAEQLIHYYDHPEFVRRVAGVLSVQDRIAAAYAVALGKRFPPEEMKKLDQWRDQLLAEEVGREANRS